MSANEEKGGGGSGTPPTANPAGSDTEVDQISKQPSDTASTSRNVEKEKQPEKLGERPEKAEGGEKAAHKFEPQSDNEPARRK